MTEVVIFHHALGLTPGIEEFARAILGAGHRVHTPDLFDGRTFDTIEEGVAHAQEIGFDEVMDRARRAVKDLPEDLVYVGFSLGVIPAQMLAQTREGAQGAVLCYSCMPYTEFGESWPQGVPAQIHGMDADPYFADEGDLDAAHELVASTEGIELYVYAGDQHYFADTTLASYRAEPAKLLMNRVFAFLERIDFELAE